MGTISLMYTDILFLPFFLIVFALVHVFKKKPFLQNILLLIASYIFYFLSTDIEIFGILILFTLVNYTFGILQDSIGAEKRKLKKIILHSSTIINIAFLGYYKYTNFFITSYNSLITQIKNGRPLDTMAIIVPLGVSFIVFHAISYNIEVFRGMKAEKNLIDFALYMSYFTKIIAGPIERPNKFLPQLKQAKTVTSESFGKGFELVLIGYFKKIVIANIIAELMNTIFKQEINDIPSLSCLVTVFLYTFQLYADFSGYSNLSRGFSKLLGIDLMINFNYPYLSKNPSEFWRGWHISLSTWLRDYLYIPLGGSRVKKWKMYRNLMITMLIAGFWHGAGLNFIVWGGLHGIYLVIHRIGKDISLKIKERRKGKSKQKKRNPYINIFYSHIKNLGSWLITFLAVSFAWIFFRIEDTELLKAYLVKIFDIPQIISELNNISWSLVFSGLVIDPEYLAIRALFLYSIILFTLDYVQKRKKQHTIFQDWKPFPRAIAYLTLICLTIIFKIHTYSPFIYAGF